jgi:hypothetical protein
MGDATSSMMGGMLRQLPRGRHAQGSGRTEVATFRTPTVLRVYGAFQLVMGMSVVVPAPIVFLTRVLVMAVVLPIIGVVLGQGVSSLRSKVIVDRTGMHIRASLRWLDLDWSTIGGFLVEQRRLERGRKWHAVVVLRVHGRAIVPIALVSEQSDEAKSLLMWLEAKRAVADGFSPRPPDA